jgi:hypothetical protein
MTGEGLRGGNGPDAEASLDVVSRGRGVMDLVDVLLLAPPTAGWERPRENTRSDAGGRPVTDKAAKCLNTRKR